MRSCFQPNLWRHGFSNGQARAESESSFDGPEPAISISRMDQHLFTIFRWASTIPDGPKPHYNSREREDKGGRKKHHYAGGLKYSLWQLWNESTAGTGSDLRLFYLMLGFYLSVISFFLDVVVYVFIYVVFILSLCLYISVFYCLSFTNFIALTVKSETSYKSNNIIITSEVAR